MNTKKALTIGLLSIATISLLACAIFLSYKKKEYQPKVLDTYADYSNTSTDINNNSFIYNSDIIFNYNINYQNILKNNEGQTNNSFTFNITPTSITGGTFTPQTSTYTIQNINGTPNNIRIQFRECEITNFSPSIYAGTYNYSYRIIVRYQNVELATTPTIIGEIENFTINNYNYLRFGADFMATQEKQITTAFSQQEIILFSTGNEQGYTTGSNEGYTNGYDEGYTDGYSNGYSTGYDTKGDLADGNFINIRTMMLNVLTMPFTFINQAFNVTLWEGTAYAFNVGNFIKGLIAIASILFIIRLFTSGFSIIGNYTGDIRARNDTHKLRKSQTELNNAKTKATNENRPKVTHQYVHKD